MAKRRVIRGGNRSVKTRLLQLGASFTSPSRFKRYWLSAQGARRIGMIAGAFVLFIVAIFAFFAKDLPSPSKINAQIGAENTIFYDRTGQTQIYEVHGDKNRRIIQFNQMPKNLKDATIAIEDRNFYHEGAFSALGILRASITDLTRRGEVQGGSTITQQYVKNALLDPTDHTVTRKIKELILSLEIEQLYKKDDILKLYLNEIPYGSEAYGVEAACRTFFGTDQGSSPTCSQNLTLAQSATLAAMENLPTYYSPYGEHVDELKDRQRLVLDLMVKQGMITQKVADAAKLTPNTASTADLAAQIGIPPDHPKVQTDVTSYPHFALYAQEYLENKYGANTVENGGLKVITSLDIPKQTMMQQAMQDDPNGIKSVRRNNGSNIAMVSADPSTGQVLAMMGSYDPNDPTDGAFNVALANRQPGSSFKPFVYATLFGMNKNGCSSSSSCPTYGAGSTLYDVKTDFGGGYTPKDYSGQYSGVQSIRTALDNSLNIPAVKALYIAGITNSINTAHALGITTLNKSDPADNYGLSLVLGSGEVKLNDMVNGYESFANGGMHYAATPILKVTDPHNHVLEDNSKPKTAKRVLDPQIAYLIDNILSDNQARAMEFGLNSPLHIAGRTVAAKTGTTEQYNDAWTLGYTKQIVTGVWVGNNDDTPMSTQAVDIAAPIWHDYMAGFYDPVTKQRVQGALAESGEPTSDTWTAPPGIQTLTVDSYTGGAVTSSTRVRHTDIFPSWYKIPSICTMRAEIPDTDPSYSRWEPPVAALAARFGYSSGGGSTCNRTTAAPPTSTNPSVALSVTGSGPFQIVATVTPGTNPINQISLYDDDQLISSGTPNTDNTYSLSYTPTAPGSHTIKAVATDSQGNTGQTDTVVTYSGTGTTGGGGAGTPTTPQPPTNPRRTFP